jgi:membrane-bound ClpP family serine protease
MAYSWAWAIVLLAGGFGLAILEVFFPSAGILGFLSVCAMVAAIVVAFQGPNGVAVGFGILASAIFGLPIVVALALKYWPRTAIGRRILLAAPTEEEVLPETSRHKRLRALIGQVGTAKSKMLPSGAVVIDGRTVDAVSEGMAVEPGQLVRVIEVRGNRVVVRLVDEETPSEDAEDPLARPLDSLGLEGLDEPLS